MTDPDDMSRPPELHETTTDAEVGMLDLYLSCTAKCMEGVQKLHPPKFNTKLCEYLRNKLRLVVESASSFLEVSRIEHNGPGLSVDAAMLIATFKLMLVRAKEIEIFILGCSEDAWLQAAMTMTNVSEYVASIGFNLELCRVVFCKECGAAGCGGPLTLEQVKAINDEEVRIVKEMALVDGDTLFRKVVCHLPKMLPGTDEKDLAVYLLQRLIKVEAVSPSVASSGSSWYSGISDSFLSLFNRPEQIGRGVSAVVYKGMWLGKPVAKKTFEGQDNPGFMKEVEILAKLSHPNITSMFCCQKNKRSCSILMELMDGNLNDLLEGCGQSESESPPFTILEKVDIMLEIGEGVTYLHEKGVIHRDLKSRNILVKRTVLAKQSDVEIRFVRSKVADFGISKSRSRSITYSSQTVNTGTDRWMAPEVIDLGGDREVSPSSEPKRPKKIDVYSFGMLCYEILTGDIPFSHEPYPRIVKQKILKGDRPDLPGDCPLMLKALIKECWDQTPEKRPSFPFICSKLKYVKYLLMAGLSGNEDPHPTSGSKNVDVKIQIDFVDLEDPNSGFLSGKRRQDTNPLPQESDHARSVDDRSRDHIPEAKRFRGVRYLSGRRKFRAEMRKPGSRYKTYFGDFKSATEAARVVDVASYYYGMESKLNFADTPQILAAEKLRFVKEQAMRVASGLLPSSPTSLPFAGVTSSAISGLPFEAPEHLTVNFGFRSFPGMRDHIVDGHQL